MSGEQTVLASAAVHVVVPAGTTPADLTAIMQAVYALLQQNNLTPIRGLIAVKGHSPLAVPVPE